MNRCLADIQAARSEGCLPQRFKFNDLRKACPGWPDPAYPTFLPRHRVGNSDRNWPNYRRNKDRSDCFARDWPS